MKYIFLFVLLSSQAFGWEIEVTYPDSEVKRYTPATVKPFDIPVQNFEWKCKFGPVENKTLPGKDGLPYEIAHIVCSKGVDMVGLTHMCSKLNSGTNSLVIVNRGKSYILSMACK